MHQVADVASIIIVLAIIAVLVAPSSQGPQFVNSIGSSFSGAIKAANSPFGG